MVRNNQNGYADNRLYRIIARMAEGATLEQAVRVLESFNYRNELRRSKPGLEYCLRKIERSRGRKHDIHLMLMLEDENLIKLSSHEDFYFLPNKPLFLGSNHKSVNTDASKESLFVAERLLKLNKIIESVVDRYYGMGNLVMEYEKTLKDEFGDELAKK
jgi:hypothetical protein